MRFFFSGPYTYELNSVGQLPIICMIYENRNLVSALIVWLQLNPTLTLLMQNTFSNLWSYKIYNITFAGLLVTTVNQYINRKSVVERWKNQVIFIEGVGSPAALVLILTTKDMSGCCSRSGTWCSRLLARYLRVDLGFQITMNPGVALKRILMFWCHVS